MMLMTRSGRRRCRSANSSAATRSAVGRAKAGQCASSCSHTRRSTSSDVRPAHSIHGVVYSASSAMPSLSTITVLRRAAPYVGWTATGGAGGFVLSAAAGWLWLCFGPDYDLGVYP